MQALRCSWNGRRNFVNIVILGGIFPPFLSAYISGPPMIRPKNSDLMSLYTVLFELLLGSLDLPLRLGQVRLLLRQVLFSPIRVSEDLPLFGLMKKIISLPPASRRAHHDLRTEIWKQASYPRLRCHPTY